MRQIDLHEYRRSDSVALSASERKGLRGVPGSQLAIEAAKEDGHFHLTPKSTIGAFRAAGLSVSIRPKLDISRVLFLASYALDEFKLRDEDRQRLREAPDLVQAMARLLVVAARRAFSRGLLRGYRCHEEALTTVRGRIRFADQCRRRFGIPLPIEVRYDEFTEDISANRLVKAAATALARMRLWDRNDRAALHQVLVRLENVALVEYSRKHVPEVHFDRLNEHYRDVVALSRLVLQHASVETGSGATQAPGFLMDMNQVFEKFVVRALRKELNMASRTLRTQQLVHLDEGQHVSLKPDLSWWEGGACTFVGDAKYKRIDHTIPNADLYQLLAYATALDLPGGLLVYAQGAESKEYRVRHAGKLLEVFAFDLSGTRQQLLDQVRALADRVLALRETARRRKAGKTSVLAA